MTNQLKSAGVMASAAVNNVKACSPLKKPAANVGGGNESQLSENRNVWLMACGNVSVCHI